MKSVSVMNFQAELEISELKRLRVHRKKLTESIEFENFSFWTMLDLMTLILIFFIILYTNLLMQQPEDYSKKSLKTASSIQIPVAQPKAKELDVKQKERFFMQKPNPFPAIEKKLLNVMKNTGVSDYTIATTGNRTMLTIEENLTFSVGQAQLLDHIKPTLKDLAFFFSEEDTFKIIVSGHTDNTPINTSKFSSNWELSVARALSVAKFLINENVDPLRISVEGFGQYRPIADNDFSEGRKANRRVEISLIHE